MIVKQYIGDNMEKRIEDLRNRLNKIVVKELMPMKQLAQEIGVHASTISDFLYGRGRPQITMLAKIERFILAKEQKCI